MIRSFSKIAFFISFISLVIFISFEAGKKEYLSNFILHINTNFKKVPDFFNFLKLLGFNLEESDAFQNNLINLNNV